MRNIVKVPRRVELQEEIDVVKRFVYDLVRELADKTVIDKGWEDTCEVLFDKETRKSLERSVKDARKGNVTLWSTKKKIAKHIERKKQHGYGYKKEKGVNYDGRK